MTTKERLVEFAKKKGLGRNKFEEYVGIAIGYLSSKSKTITSDTIELVLVKFPNINLHWLLTGQGDMEISEIGSNPIKESDDSIYHFTNKIENLIDIMKQKFVPHYCAEDMFYFYGNPKGGENEENEMRTSYPLVCFCDIPIERHADHMIKYGKYGIGMNKNWAIRKQNLATILYANRENINGAAMGLLIKFGMWFEKIYDDLKKQYNPTENYLLRLKNSLNILIMCHKPYEKSGVRFYDEREWRYIPFIDNMDLAICRFNYKNDKEFEEAIEKGNQKLRENKKAILDFAVEDIDCIILERDEEQDVFIESLKELYSETDIGKIKRLIRITPVQSELKEDTANPQKETNYTEEKIYEKKYNELLEENRELLKENRGLRIEIDKHKKFYAQEASAASDAQEKTGTLG